MDFLLSDISLHPETAADDAFLRNLHASGRIAGLAVAPWTNGQKAAFIDQQFDLQRHHYRTYYPTADFLIVKLANQPVGRIYLHRGETAWLLIDIALLPECQGQGIGGLLLKNMLADAATLNKPVRLHVGQSNRAQELYLRLGFTVIEDEGIRCLMEWRP
ncbi:MAG: GNAT family N-acetyltransferase [Methylobacter sp.]|nr:MAG: GNAT family N-acetyltransferase [Methylobacter sp.]